jgi:hypothetical protein
MHSQETFNNSIVDKILSFSMHPHSTYLVKPNQSYSNQKTVRKREFRQKVGNWFGVVELALELSYQNNLVITEAQLMILSDWG